MLSGCNWNDQKSNEALKLIKEATALAELIKKSLAKGDPGPRGHRTSGNKWDTRRKRRSRT
ncbi:hypothetical protein CKC_03255 [Candidatus Liberibacter solanacearum CLso-ZC1]|uniref:Uncharacterized protein n=1 Tax=Liberibacter solanacearum (strain CLso-ZC1) TaxID=658172 RepID=E4UB09_LIBSC|nr:hypothetical protein CKC_03255 [Candidatus Liberibacter solanacearum CLso-ZC1]